MASRGPILPRKDRTASEARSALGNCAFQIGVLLSIQRNRWGLRQEDLAAEIGRKQGDISALERGARPSRPLSEEQLKKLFKILDLTGEKQLREFLAWWQIHG